MTHTIRKKLAKIGFWGTAGTAGWLMLRSFSFILENGKTLNAALIAWIGLSFFFTIISERVKTFGKQGFFSSKEYSAKQYAGNFLAVLAGTFVTFWLNHFIGLGGVAASALTGAAVGALFPRYAAPVYCGSFVGMACNIIFSSPVYLLLAASLSGILYVLAEECFQGIGGKLGTIAFFGTFMASLLLQRPLRIGLPAEREIMLPLFLWTLVAGLLTFLLKEKGQINAVTASSIVGLCLGLLLPVLYPEFGNILSVAAFCATFTGMSASERLGGTSGMAAASFLTSLLFAAAYPLFDGSGGKLGTIAFVSSLSIAGLRGGIAQMKQRYWTRSSL